MTDTLAQDLDVVKYADVKRELDLMNDALQNGNLDAARHHEFVALIMTSELAREQKIIKPIKSENNEIVLSAQACIALA